MGRIIKFRPCPRCGNFSLTYDQYWGYCCHNCGGTWTSDEMEAIRECRSYIWKFINGWLIDPEEE